MNIKTLEPKHIVPYLPHKLKFVADKSIWTIVGLKHDIKKWHVVAWWDNLPTYDEFDLDAIGPLLLHPLSDLVKKIHYHGREFVPLSEFYEITDCRNPNNEKDTRYDIEYLIEHKIIDEVEWIYMEKLFEWKFDVFGLIDNGLAQANLNA